MKVGSLKRGGRDGTLVLVSRDLRRGLEVPEIARTMQRALDDWADVVPRLQERYEDLQADRAEGAFALDPVALAAPLPRAYQWCDGSAYLSHAELVRKARGAEMPESLYSDPLMYQGGSDTMLGPRDDVVVADAGWGIDLEAELAVVTDDVHMGVGVEAAVGHIKLVTIVNDVSLRLLMPEELAKGFGFFQSKPSTAFAPVFVTPDELGDAWNGRRLALPMHSQVNDTSLGQPDTGADLDFDFATLIAHAAKSRTLGAGTIIGSGTISNRDRAVGSSCLQEKRMIEKIETGAFVTPFLQFGDIVRIEIRDAAGDSIFGALENRIVQG